MDNAFSEISVVLKNPTLDPVNNTLNFEITAIGDKFHYDKIEMDEVTLFIDEVRK